MVSVVRGILQWAAVWVAFSVREALAEERKKKVRIKRDVTRYEANTDLFGRRWQVFYLLIKSRLQTFAHDSNRMVWTIE